MYIDTTLLAKAQKVISNPNILINLVSKRVWQLRNGGDPLVHPTEKSTLENIALREIIDHKISYSL
ncbi:MAG: DNA-directed RNA polymerase subunit omega [Opitutales bacterium]|nr:DNA-directed RNA polymerase subunit omega [Opitutales bacterium]